MKALSKQDKKAIGGDIKTVRYGWPLDMPVVRKMETGLWDIRCRLDKRIARILFAVIHYLQEQEGIRLEVKARKVAWCAV